MSQMQENKPVLYRFPVTALWRMWTSAKDRLWGVCVCASVWTPVTETHSAMPVVSIELIQMHIKHIRINGLEQASRAAISNSIQTTGYN